MLKPVKKENHALASADLKYLISLAIKGLFQAIAVSKLLCQITAIAMSIIHCSNIPFIKIKQSFAFFCIMLPHFYH